MAGRGGHENIVGHEVIYDSQGNKRFSDQVIQNYLQHLDRKEKRHNFHLREAFGVLQRLVRKPFGDGDVDYQTTTVFRERMRNDERREGTRGH